MSDVKSKKLIYLKGFLFLVILLSSTGLIIYETRSWKIVLLLALTIWASSRIYYFMFYVIEKHVDSTYKFASIFSFLKYLFSNKQK